MEMQVKTIVDRLKCIFRDSAIGKNEKRRSWSFLNKLVPKLELGNQGRGRSLGTRGEEGAWEPA